MRCVPSDQIIVIVFFADARKIRGESAAFHLVAFANGVARKTTARFKQLLAMRGIAGLVFGQRIGQARIATNTRR